MKVVIRILAVLFALIFLVIWLPNAIKLMLPTLEIPSPAELVSFARDVFSGKTPVEFPEPTMEIVVHTPAGSAISQSADTPQLSDETICTAVGVTNVSIEASEAYAYTISKLENETLTAIAEQISGDDKAFQTLEADTIYYITRQEILDARRYGGQSAPLIVRTLSIEGLPDYFSFDEKVLFALTNYERARRGLPEYQPLQSLAETARDKSRDMDTRDYFDHTEPTGQPFNARLERFGVPYSLCGENIAKLYPMTENDLYMLHHGWMYSEGHRENILSVRYAYQGVGVFRNEANESKIHATQHFVQP